MDHLFWKLWKIELKNEWCALLFQGNALIAYKTICNFHITNLNGMNHSSSQVYKNMFFGKKYIKNYFDLILCATWIKPLFG